MPDFKAARINMVDSQIHPMGVVNEDILEAFRTVRREDFVPESRSAIAYCDENLTVSKGRCLMEPVTQARLIQAALPLPADIVLDIGGATGYSAAIWASLAARVVAVEPNASLLEAAQKSWAGLGRSNILPHNGPFAAGYAPGAPYSLIFINGSVCEVPQALIDQLAPSGRLVGIVKTRSDKIGRAVLLTKGIAGGISERILFEAAVPYLPGQEPRNEFVF